MDIYDDIMNMPRHESKTRRKMTNLQRAAQFAPFAALTGYDGLVAEVYRLTDSPTELSPDAIYELNIKLEEISGRVGEGIRIMVTYFIRDAKKDGGAYVTVEDNVEKIDSFEGVLITENFKIPIKDMVAIGICGEDYN